MINFTRVSLASVGLGVGLVVGGCAGTIDDEGEFTDETTFEQEAALTEADMADDPSMLAALPEGALTDQTTADDADDADLDEKVFFGRRLGWGGFGGVPFGGFAGYRGLGGFYGGVPGWGLGRGFIGPGLGYGYGGFGPGLGYGYGFGRGLGWGWGGSVSCINGVCF